MADARCPGCGAALAGAVRFCMACGAPVSVPPGAAAAAPAPSAVLPDTEPRLVHCAACEASNAASRERCGRCGADLRTGVALDEGAEPVAEEGPPAEGSDTPVLFTVVVVMAGLAILGVLATLASARGFGVFPSIAPEETPLPEAVPVVAVEVSSTLPPSGDITFGPENLLDGDDGTAWIEGASGDGIGEWVELRLAEVVPVTRIVLWNGYQRDERFAEYARVTELRLVVEDTSLSADVLDLEGPQAIDFPEPVTTDRVRLEVIGAQAGSRYQDVALSGIEVFAARED